MTFKKETEIYEDLKTKITAYIPELTYWESGSIIRALTRSIASAIRLLYVNLENLYFNIFPTYADRAALRRYYEDFGIPWDNPSTENARKTVLNYYRQKGIGTKEYFRQAVLSNFPEVTSCTVQTNMRGPNTIDLILSYHGHPVPEDTIAEIQDFFNSDDKKICGIDMLVKTIPDYSTKEE